ncbi:MAG: phage antirepressor KilAC domain-containing protein [Cetobacterium sp.]
MNQSVQVFEGNKVKIIELNGKPMFELYSTGYALGYGRLKIVKNKEYREIQKNRIEGVVERAEIELFPHDGQLYITESQLYDFMLEARTEKCKIFKKWVTEEVLPTINNTGGYISNDDQFINVYFPFADESTKVILKNTFGTVRKQNELIASQKKTIVNQDAIISNVIKDDGLYAIGIVGKILKPYCNNMGAIKIFTYLRDNKILMNYPGTQKHNLPYDKYSHYFEVKYVDVNKGFHSFTESKTYFKGNGLKYLLNKLVQDKHMTSKSSEKVKETFSNMEGAI